MKKKETNLRTRTVQSLQASVWALSLSPSAARPALKAPGAVVAMAGSAVNQTRDGSATGIWLLLIQELNPQLMLGLVTYSMRKNPVFNARSVFLSAVSVLRAKHYRSGQALHRRAIDMV